MKRLALFLVPLLAAASSSRAQENDRSEDRLRSMLQYVTCLERAEKALEASKPDEAVRHAREALDSAVADSAVKRMNVVTRGAAAHFLLACALSMKRDTESALLHLERAAQNGFTDTERVRTDPRLKRARMHARFAELLSRFPKGTGKDRYSGKTVADQKFGMGLIHARKMNFPRAGEIAPDFQLEVQGKRSTLKLSSFRGKSPVVLIFGSYT